MLVIFLLLAVTGSIVSGNILRIPEDFPTVAEAVSEASDHDTLLISRGVYPERIIAPVQFQLTLMSQYAFTSDTTDILETVLIPDPSNPPDTAAIIEVYSRRAHMVLQGLTLREGVGVNVEESPEDWRMGGAIYQLAGEITLENCLFTQNIADIGIAIWSQSSQLNINDCNFSQNGIGTFNQGVVRGDTTDIVIRRTRFHDNIARGGSAVIGAYGSLLMDSCVIDSNLNYHATFHHVAFRNGSASVSNCDFLSNSGDTTFIGAPCLRLQNSDALIDNCRFIGNTSKGQTALSMTDVQAEITNCLFERNRASFACTAQAFNGSGRIQRCSFIENSAYSWSCLDAQGDWTIEECIFRGNISEWDTAAAIFVHRFPLTARHCIFEDNVPYAVGTYDIVDMQPQHFENCWWGDPSGPYHETLNPSGLGDVIIGDSISFIPWLTEPPQSVAEYPPELPSDKEFLRAYPNPFNSQITLEYRSAPQTRQLMIYDLLGRQTEIIDIPPFSQRILWQPSQLPSGIYFARLQEMTAKLVYMR